MIDSNVITNTSEAGIRVDAGDRPVQFDGCHDQRPAAPGNGDQLCQSQHASILAPGVVIQNNVIAYSGSEGINFRGDTGTNPLGPVPYGRIVNNTIFGDTTPTGTGILVADNASPTILNNIFAYLQTGIQVKAAAGVPATEIGHNLFQGNANDGTTGSFAFTSTDPDPDTLFVNSSLRNFYLVRRRAGHRQFAEPRG